MANIIEKNNLAHLKYILKINSIYRIFDINKVRNKNQQTVLHMACQRGSHDAILILCQFNAKGEIMDVNGITPMQEAIRNRNTNNQTLTTLKILIDYGFNYNEALNFAAAEGKIEIAHYIEKYGKERELYLRYRCKIKNLVFQGSHLYLSLKINILS